MLKRVPWIFWYLAVIAVLWIAAWFTVDGFDEVLFNPPTTASITGLLLPLLVVATFIERAVEVYVNTSREPKKKELERAAEGGGDTEKMALAEFKTAHRHHRRARAVSAHQLRP